MVSINVCVLMVCVLQYTKYYNRVYKLIIVADFPWFSGAMLKKRWWCFHYESAHPYNNLQPELTNSCNYRFTQTFRSSCRLRFLQWQPANLSQIIRTTREIITTTVTAVLYNISPHKQPKCCVVPFMYHSLILELHGVGTLLSLTIQDTWTSLVSAQGCKCITFWTADTIAI